ncbi:hypothetical protein GUJ93_ZPchr0009g860 [Zizania palustris]|uniref:Uncharacterized protein n=1 Tax=Zizania palustris TaxID=103762 RepID=A0A8J5S6A4_ZIZPA|nr:hypothetical protein GUJ93_ZPchr0009g860 [Zizania palustris]
MASEARGDQPLLRAVEVARVVAGEGTGLPSVDLAGILVSNLCFTHNSSSLWKLVGHAFASRFLCPLHVLALLTPRVLPQRRAQSEAYRLYLELLKCNVMSSSLFMEPGPNRDNAAVIGDVEIGHGSSICWIFTPQEKTKLDVNSAGI